MRDGAAKPARRRQRALPPLAQVLWELGRRRGRRPWLYFGSVLFIGISVAAQI